MGLMIRELFAPDINADFFTALSALAEVGLDMEEAKRVFQDRLRQGVHTYIAILDGQIVGTASLLVERKFIHKGGRVGHIEDVAVNPAHQRKGVGKALVGHLEERAREKGCYKTILDCFDNLEPFYASCGYVKYGAQMRKNLA
jgi:glucosamine-phosphate N-acetyltransferase